MKKSTETILPFSCCPVVFLWFNQVMQNRQHTKVLAKSRSGKTTPKEEILCQFSLDTYPWKVQKGQKLPASVEKFENREWPRYCPKVYWTETVQTTILVENDLVPNWILAFAAPKWTKMVHFGPFRPEEVHLVPFRSANRTLAIPDLKKCETSAETILPSSCCALLEEGKRPPPPRQDSASGLY